MIRTLTYALASIIYPRVPSGGTMLTYLQRLRDERDSLSAASSGILEKAAKEERSATDTEKESIGKMAERCAAIDAELKTFSEQYESQRAYAKLRQALDSANEPEPNGNGDGNGKQTRKAVNLETRPLDWGTAVAQSDALKAYSGHGRSAVIEVGPAYETRTPPSPPASNPIMTDWPPEGVIHPYRWTGNATETWTPRLLPLVNTVTVNAGAVDWVRYQPHPPSEAQIVPEGELKPEADISIELKSGTLDTLAHHKVISRQALDDIPGIRQEVENRLRQGVLVKLQSLLADAINNETDYPTVAAPDLLSGIRMAIGEMDDVSGFVPNGVLLNPADWAAIDLAIMTGTLSGPQVNNTAFNLRFVASRAVSEGTAYVGNFNTAFTLFQRSTTSVFMSDSHDDLFLRNMIAIVAEMRALAVVTEPMAVVEVTASSGRSVPSSAPSGSTSAPSA